MRQAWEHHGARSRSGDEKCEKQLFIESGVEAVSPQPRPVQERNARDRIHPSSHSNMATPSIPLIQVHKAIPTHTIGCIVDSGRIVPPASAEIEAVAGGVRSSTGNRIHNVWLARHQRKLAKFILVETKSGNISRERGREREVSPDTAARGHRHRRAIDYGKARCWNASCVD